MVGDEQPEGDEQDLPVKDDEGRWPVTAHRSTTSLYRDLDPVAIDEVVDLSGMDDTLEVAFEDTRR